jgi:hypothetical protein
VLICCTNQHGACKLTVSVALLHFREQQFKGSVDHGSLGGCRSRRLANAINGGVLILLRALAKGSRTRGRNGAWWSGHGPTLERVSLAAAYSSGHDATIKWKVFRSPGSTTLNERCNQSASISTRSSHASLSWSSSSWSSLQRKKCGSGVLGASWCWRQSQVNAQCRFVLWVHPG